MSASENGLVNLDWAHAILDVLVAAGLEYVVLSPGSRSTPLALAANRHPDIELVIVLDERAAGFHALGIARVSERPVALIATSGTAGANYHPALAEAAAWGVPLVALTADRPPRLRGLGAAQTIDQVRLFGPTTAYLELAIPSPEPRIRRAAAQRVAIAVAATAGSTPGPLHVNVPFDEPLAPGREALAAWQPPAEHPPQVIPARMTADEAAIQAIAARVAAAKRPVLLAGPGAGDLGAADALLAWALALDMPVIADVGSGLRGGRGGSVVMNHADLWLRPTLALGFTPDLLILTGRMATSKAVGSWAAGCGAPAIALWPDAIARDPDALAELVAIGDVADAALRLAALVPDRSDVDLDTPVWESEHPDPRVDWLASWCAEDFGAAQALEHDGPVSSEAAAVRAATNALPDGGLLVLSNSMPIRHADGYMGDGPAGHVPLVLRGANGIDGVTAAALGAARAAGRPTLLITGDLAFLHDLGGLATAKGLETPVVVLVLDNDGGAIFHHLPVASAAPDFEELFATPQGRDLAHVAALYDLPYEVAGDVGAAVARGFTTPGVSIVVQRSVRTEVLADHQALVKNLTSRPPAWHMVYDGDAEQPALVLLHGFGADHRVWTPLLPALADSWNVHGPDLPGHGRTGVPTGDLAAAARQLAADLSELDRPVVVGYSLGGRLALHLALEMELGGLVLVGASAGLADPAERAARVTNDDAWAARLTADYEKYLTDWDAQPLFAERAGQPVADYRLDQQPQALAAAMRAFSTGRQDPLHERLGEIQAPVVLLAGEHDSKFRAIAAELVTQFPHARVVIAAGAGHDVPTDNPSAVLAALAALAQPVDPTPA